MVGGDEREARLPSSESVDTPTLSGDHQVITELHLLNGVLVPPEFRRGNLCSEKAHDISFRLILDIVSRVVSWVTSI